MQKPTLYLMLGYPGAGKTTAARIIHELTGATHLWADKIRRERFGEPTYSSAENEQLYDELNQQTLGLLTSGHSVIFDTSFNYFKDRENLREIAKQAGAACIVVWLTIDENTARMRATTDAHLQDTRPHGDMSDQEFQHLVSRLEPPQPDEPYTELDGTKITPDYVKKALKI